MRKPSSRISTHCPDELQQTVATEDHQLTEVNPRPNTCARRCGKGEGVLFFFLTQNFVTNLYFACTNWRRSYLLFTTSTFLQQIFHSAHACYMCRLPNSSL